jgi:hypothetical protein
MTHRLKPGDIVYLYGTRQEAEVLDSDEHEFYGQMLRVNLLGVEPEVILFFAPHMVSFVRSAEPVRESLT